MYHAINAKVSIIKHKTMIMKHSPNQWSRLGDGLQLGKDSAS